MTLLLDTQIAIWWLVGSRRLSRATRDTLARSACMFSVASIWEIAIKHRIGKLGVAPTVFRDGMLAAGAELLVVTDRHAIETAALPRHHDDPFDRMLIAQARVEGLKAVTVDRAWSRYEVELVSNTKAAHQD